MALKTITHLGVIDYLFLIKGESISILPIYVIPWMFEPHIHLCNSYAEMVIEESMTGEGNPWVCFCLSPLSQTYHIRLSSIT